MGFDSSAPDLEPLAKRARLDTGNAATLSIHSPVIGVLEQDGDDADSDFYGDEHSHEPVKITNGIECADSTQNADQTMSPSGSGIPGLLMMDDEVSRQLEVEHTASKDIIKEEPKSSKDEAPSQTAPEQTTYPEATEMSNFVTGEDVAMEITEDVNESAPQKNQVTVESPTKPEEANEKEAVDGVKTECGVETDGVKTEGAERVEEVVKDDETDTNQVKADEVDPSWIASMLSSNADKTQKPPPDPEFLALAKAQKDDENAEWRYDTSDAESSDSDSTSDSDSDSDNESGDEGYSGMNPEEIAKVLMQEEYNDDGPQGAPGPLRTKNEVPEDEKVERPNIVVTPEMKTEELGKVESTVDNMVLVKASVSGDYQVLSEGSLLVLDDRSVIGVVADTLGRVEEPLYTIRFNSAEEITDLKVEEGKKIFYVPEHSTYVFTKPLLAQKGSDASNLYDEEAAESELEFSDDEAEAEYKKKKKEARKNTAANKNPKDRKPKPAQSWAPPEPPAPAGPPTLNYDEPYVPLQRPANLHEMVAQPPPPPPSSLRGGRGGRGGKGDRGDRGGFRGGRGNDRGRGGNRGRGNEGRGRGNDRGRGDRGRGNGPGGDRGRGVYDRGGYDGGRGRGRDHPRNRSPRAQRDQFKQNRDDPSTPTTPSFNQQHSSQNQIQGQSHQNKQYQSSQPHPPPLPLSQFPGFSGQQQQQPAPTSQGGWQQSPGFPQFPQFPMPFQQLPFPGIPSVSPMAQAPLPSGAHLNPSFFGGQQNPPPPQQQQQPHTQVPAWMQGYGVQQQQNYQPPQPNSDEAFKALQNTLAMLKGHQNQQQ